MKNTLFIIIALLALTSCKKEVAGGGGELSDNSVLIRLSTSNVLEPRNYASRSRAGESVENGLPVENLVKDITVLIFSYKSDGTGVLEAVQNIPLNPLPVDQIKWATDSTLIVGNVVNMSMPKSVYVVANWTKASPAYDGSDFVIGTTPENTMKAKLTAISSQIAAPTDATPMLMEGHTIDYNFSTHAQKATIGMVRQAAKIRLSISLNEAFKSANPDIEWGITTIGGVHTRAVNIPNRSFVAMRNPSSSPTVVDDPSYALIHYPFGVASVPQTTQYVWRDSIYLYENPVRGLSPNKPTYVILHMPYVKNGITNNSNYYKVYIKNLDNTVDPYMVERNIIYDIKVDIKGFGMSEELATPDALQVSMTVINWTPNQLSTSLDDSKDDSKAEIIIPPWDTAYNPGTGNIGGDTGIGGEDEAEDDRNSVGSGDIKPWDPNGNGGIII